MGFQRWLERLGFVRARDFGLILTPDRRLLTTRAVRNDGYGGVVVGWIDDDLVIEPPVAVPEPMPEYRTEPIDERAIEHVEHAVAAAPEQPPPEVDEPEEPEDEWEWEIAVARARASSDSLPQARGSSNSLPQVIDPPVATDTEPMVAIRETPPTDPASRPRTVIPVPILPSGQVRNYEAPRFARATNRGMAAVSLPVRPTVRR